jgi:hypothetical protein
MNSVALYPTLFFVAMSRLSNILNVVLTAQPSLLDAQVKMQALHFCNKTALTFTLFFSKIISMRFLRT